MRLVSSSFVELVSANNGKFTLLAAGGIKNPVGACCNKLTQQRYTCVNNAQRNTNSNTLTRTTASFWGHRYYFSTSSSARHFNSETVVSNNNNPICLTNSKTECCENKRRGRATTTTTLSIGTRTCWLNYCCGGGGVRNFSTGSGGGPSSFLRSDTGGRTPDKPKEEEETRKDTKFLTPRLFMEQQGAKPGQYVNYMLGMTPAEEDPTVFRGNPLYIHPTHKIAFGGCLLGQALSAAVRSVPKGLYVHSLHNYFLNAGRVGSVDYHVENVRDGNTYCNRFVKAMQNGKNVVNMQVSFKKDETDQYQFQSTMPKCKGPEELENATKLMTTKLSEDIGDDLKKILKNRLPIDPVVEFRPVDPEEMYRIKPLPPKRRVWVKIIEKLDDDDNFQRCATAFLSDYLIITTALLPNENSLQKFFITSLDHSIWFHNKFRVDDWLLYETESCHTGAGVGFSTGRFWTQDGVLAASVAQQGVVRSLL